MKNIFLRVIPEGECVPWWLGFTFRRLPENEMVYSPVFLNVLFMWIRDFWFIIRSAGRNALDSKVWKSGHEAGYECAMRIIEDRDMSDSIEELGKRMYDGENAQKPSLARTLRGGLFVYRLDNLPIDLWEIKRIYDAKPDETRYCTTKKEFMENIEKYFGRDSLKKYGYPVTGDKPYGEIR